MRHCSNCHQPGHYSKTCKNKKSEAQSLAPLLAKASITTLLNSSSKTFAVKLPEAAQSIPEKAKPAEAAKPHAPIEDESVESEGEPEIKADLLVRTAPDAPHIEGVYYYIQVGKGTVFKFGNYDSDKAALNAMLAYNKRMRYHHILCVSQLFVFRDGALQEIIAK
jgi:hypothetical protein